MLGYEADKRTISIIGNRIIGLSAGIRNLSLNPLPPPQEVPLKGQGEVTQEETGGFDCCDRDLPGDPDTTSTHARKLGRLCFHTGLEAGIPADRASVTYQQGAFSPSRHSTCHRMPMPSGGVFSPRPCSLSS